MGKYNVEAVSSIGVVKETPAHRLPPEAWTHALNVRFADKRAERMGGHASVMGTPLAAPAFLLPVDNAGDVFWIYAEADGAGSKVHVYNSGTHNDISQMGGYTVSNYRDWNGDIFQGIPILNYGGGTPQYWPTPNVVDLLEDIPDWPASTTAKVLKAFGNYIVALNITDASGGHPDRVLWSDGAGPGELPASWDVTDPAFEADHRDLSDTSGQILDGVALRDFFVILKNESMWIMRYIGGTFIHSIKPQLRAAGTMAARCSCVLNIGRTRSETMFTMTGEDLGNFDGNDFLSVVEDKDRKFLTRDIDAVNFENSFVLDNRIEDEAWFCYPENGEVDPSMACVWNYKENTITFREFQGVHAANGPVEGASDATWATVMGTWDTQGPSKWQEAARRKVVVADEENTLLLQLEAAETFNGASFTSTLQRFGLAVTGTDREGNPIVNYNSRKIVTRVWPKVNGADIRIRVGGSDSPNEDNITWGPYTTFSPANGDRYVDPAGDDAPLNFVYTAIEFSSVEDEHWELEGYLIEIQELSEL